MKDEMSQIHGIDAQLYQSQANPTSRDAQPVPLKLYIYCDLDIDRTPGC